MSSESQFSPLDNTNGRITDLWGNPVTISVTEPDTLGTTGEPITFHWSFRTTLGFLLMEHVGHSRL